MTLRRSIVALMLAGTALAGPALADPQNATPRAAPAASAQSQQRPNVLVWLMDDVGFAQVSCFGGLVETPNIDRVAAMGLRYSNYHTAPICSASRAALLTGRMPHSVHIGGHATAARDFPGYDAHIPAGAGTIAANLHAAGYATYAVGKWDHLPNGDVSTAGPFNYWATGQGFDRFYGFLSADTDNWEPQLVRDQTPIGRPQKPGYHLSADMADQAIAMIQSRGAADPQRPFFLYWATGAAHAPHHAPAEWIARYKGKFDQGWDKVRETILQRQIAQGTVPKGTRLAALPEGMPRWDSLSPEDKQLYARQMEAFAASLSYADAQFGRMLDALAAAGELDNTIVVVTSDNGASAEGGPSGLYNEAAVTGGGLTAADNRAFLDRWGAPGTYPHYAYGWAVAGNTPFRYYKQTTHEGGTHVPLVVAWPKGIAARGELRGQFAHVSDIAPTLLAAAGVPLAQTVNDVPQVPMEGQNLTATFASARAPGHEGPQYVELYGNKGLWQDGWQIVTSHRYRTWDWQTAKTFDEPWELYDLRKDPGQTTDLAAKYPERVAAMAAAFADQAKRYNVAPIHNLSDTAGESAKKAAEDFARRGGKWHYAGPTSNLASMIAPPVNTRGFTMTAKLDLAEAGATAPIFSMGGRMGGIGFYLRDGKPTLVMNDLAGGSVAVTAADALAPGKQEIALDLVRGQREATGATPFEVKISAGGKVLAQERLSFVLPAYFGIPETFDLAADWGSPVLAGYRAGTPFPGKLTDVTFDFNGKGGGNLQVH
ncbi:arylsulfatase [Novosphingobium sp. JCM 18896]|uniref:arylsulfatase n=1 Tax=Novosphingobium sp. JCM 18896 TaxID=2989731 RepID=UPI002223D734|nr:arylsulfatase [Novosphingobium sp. JCM 18896]MCW1429517.1 arylsulfatase [Novosphingobium sp. JCM 18896]